jgi:hypothetical protein
MKRYYLFLLKGSWRTRDITAWTLKQAFNIAKREYGDKLLKSYQTCSLAGYVFSGWKSMT